MTVRFSPRLLAALVCGLAAFLAAGTAWAASPFVDIDGNVHSNNIYAIRDAGITAGCTDSVHYCPSDPVRRDQMASFIARLGGLSFGTTKNFPKVNAKGPTQAYCSLQAASPASFKTGPCRTSSAAVDFGNNVGQFSSVATGADGLPAISYRDATNGDLRYTHCGTASCTAGDNTVIVDNGGASSVGQYTSLAIGTDGLPVISYYNATDGDLKVAHCGDVYCIFPTTVTTVDTGAGSDVGAFSSIAIGSNGFPAIAYYNQTSGGLLFLRCNNVLCTDIAKTVIDNNPGLGAGTAIAIGVDGFPVISYRGSAGVLRAAHCLDTACAAADVTIVDSGDTTSTTSIAIGTDGLPIISYSGTLQILRVARCANTACTGAATITIIDASNVDQRSSIAIGTDGFPLIAYALTTGSVRVSHCTNASCSAPRIITTIDSVLGADASLAIGVDGLPTVSYYDIDNGDLRVARPTVF